MEFITLPPREALLYTSCYCEENIYKLIQEHVPPTSLKHYTVLFLSNPNASIPVFSQQLQRNPVYPVVWDYHVILVYHPNQTLDELFSSSSSSLSGNSNGQAITRAYVYDLDTTLQMFPCPFDTYFQQTFFPPAKELFAREEERAYMLQSLSDVRFQRYFRLIKAADYLDYFWSSREHMIRKETGEWIMQPPVWELIKGRKVGDVEGLEGDTFGLFVKFERCAGMENVEERRDEKEWLGVLVGEERLAEVFGSGAAVDVNGEGGAVGITGIAIAEEGENEVT